MTAASKSQLAASFALARNAKVLGRSLNTRVMSGNRSRRSGVAALGHYLKIDDNRGR